MDKTSLAHRRTSTEQASLAKLEERYRHELMDDEERCELFSRVQRLRRSGH
jgi:hypothetical protein